MELIDLSHKLTDDMPVYPGKTQPSFDNVACLETDHYREKHLSLDSHVGTHIDAPAHMLFSGKTLDQFPVSKFSGFAVVLEIPAGTKIISKEFLSRFANEMRSAEFILFNTGWHSRWRTSQFTEEFPVMDTDAAEWLISFPLKGIGVDTISVDPAESVDWPVHIKLFSKEFVIVENLKFPDVMPSKGEFFCFPLKINHADGSPVRAVFITKKN